MVPYACSNFGNENGVYMFFLQFFYFSPPIFPLPSTTCSSYFFAEVELDFFSHNFTVHSTLFLLISYIIGQACYLLSIVSDDCPPHPLENKILLNGFLRVPPFPEEKRKKKGKAALPIFGELYCWDKIKELYGHKKCNFVDK